MSENAPNTLIVAGAGALGRGLAEHLCRLGEYSVVLRGRADHPATIPTNSSLWICTKAFDVVPLIKSLGGQIANLHSVVLLSNGLGLYMEAAEAIGRSVPIVRALCSTGFELDSTSQVRQNGVLRFSLAGTDEHQRTTEWAYSLLLQLGAEVTQEKNIALAEWRKAMINIVVNTLSTLADAPNGVILDNADIFQRAVALLAEVRQVAAAEGFDISKPTNEEFFTGMRNYAQNVNASLAALRRGKKTEVEYLLGRMLRIADAYAVPCPVAQASYQAYRRMEEERTARK